MASPILFHCTATVLYRWLVETSGLRIEPRPFKGHRGAAILLTLAPWTLMVGCSAEKPFWNPFGGRAPSTATRAGTSQTRVYYTATEGLKLFAAPRRASAVVATLPLHQKVYRDSIQNGLAHVTVDGSRQEGWVENARLIWKLPPKNATSPAETVPVTPSAATPVAPDEVTTPERTPSPEPAADAQPEGTRRPSSNPTVFDPF